MLITRISQISGNVNTLDLDVTVEQLERYEQHKETVQSIFHNLNAGEREFLITGITPEEWDSIFPEEEDDE
jgi:hypothetical protein